MNRLALLVVALLMAPAPAFAQTRANPHGELPSIAECGDCHSARAWRPLREDFSFDHGRASGFPLLGRHRQTACVACHQSLRFDQARAAPQQCGACHTDVHRGRFGAAQCSNCHDTHTFRVIEGPESHARSAFPLTGAHLAVPCIRCHATERAGLFTRVDTRCTSCHRTDAMAASFPDHTLLVVLDCAQCHGTMRWRGARFDHGAVAQFDLRGAHARIACTGCHVPPDFRVRFVAASPDDCVACHRPDYDRVHAGTGFSTQCNACHGVDRWQGATFEHNQFPIFSGPHRGVWRSCSECHTAPGNFRVFTCTTCHTRNDTDDRHDDVRNYVYESTRCYACHPRGVE
jgi:hypothetical protein